MVHVNDCSIIATSIPLIDSFKTKIKTFVDITNMGELNWILGIAIKRIREQKKIFLSQTSYIDSILRRYGFDDARLLSTPMDPNIRLTSADCPSSTEAIASMRNIPYHEAIGSLMC